MTKELNKGPLGKNAAPPLMPLNQSELISINVLLTYAAHAKRMRVDLLREIVAERFAVADIKQLQTGVYDRVVRFLIDMPEHVALN